MRLNEFIGREWSVKSLTAHAPLICENVAADYNPEFLEKRLRKIAFLEESGSRRSVKDKLLRKNIRISRDAKIVATQWLKEFAPLNDDIGSALEECSAQSRHNALEEYVNLVLVDKDGGEWKSMAYAQVCVADTTCGKMTWEDLGLKLIQYRNDLRQISYILWSFKFSPYKNLMAAFLPPAFEIMIDGSYDTMGLYTEWTGEHLLGVYHNSRLRTKRADNGLALLLEKA